MLPLATITLALLFASPQTSPAEPPPVDAGTAAVRPACALLESRPDRAACGISDADQLIFGCPDAAAATEVAFHYTPERLSEHTVRTKILRCVEKACRADSGTAYFADDPDRYFEIESGLSVKKALQVARLFQAGRLVRPGFSRRALEQLMDMRLEKISALSSGYELQLVACGCESKIQVGLASEAGRDLLQIRNPRLDPPCS